MTRLSVTRIPTEGFDSIHVNTGVIELTLVTELGGKINSLRDAPTGESGCVGIRISCTNAFLMAVYNGAGLGAPPYHNDLRSEWRQSDGVNREEA